MTEHLSWLCSDVAAEDDEEDAADPEEKESSCDLITRFGSDRSKNHIFADLSILNGLSTKLQYWTLLIQYLGGEEPVLGRGHHASAGRLVAGHGPSLLL